MKAYKATYNMKCRDLTYEVGKTYSIDKLEICKRGFHACMKIDDTLNYYSYNKETVFLEVEILGEIVEEDDKLATNKMKVLRVIPVSEYNSLFEDYTFDERSNMISRTDYNGRKESWEYDERNNKISHTNYNGEKEFWEHDERNNKISFTDYDGKKIFWEYDERNNKISFTEYDGGKESYEYDKRNNLISHTYTNGEKESWEYDERNNLISFTRTRQERCHPFKVAYELPN